MDIHRLHRMHGFHGCNGIHGFHVFRMFTCGWLVDDAAFSHISCDCCLCLRTHMTGVSLSVLLLRLFFVYQVLAWVLCVCACIFLVQTIHSDFPLHVSSSLRLAVKFLLSPTQGCESCLHLAAFPCVFIFHLHLQCLIHFSILHAIFARSSYIGVS